MNTAQLSHTLDQTTGEKPRFHVFKALRSGSTESVGHIQLMDIDYTRARAVLGRVLIYREFRGHGLGTDMVRAAVNFAFHSLQLTQVTLGVFDFNTTAIEIYKRVGFSEFQFIKGARQFQNEQWNVIKMKCHCKHG